MSQQEVYKIVKRENNQYVSIRMFIDEAKVVYKPLIWNYPNPKLLNLGYGIVCFDSLENTEQFYRRFCKYDAEVKVCFKGYVDNILLEKVKIFSPHSTITFEKLLENIEYWGDNYSWPKGTIMASRIRLTNKIWER